MPKCAIKGQQYNLLRDSASNMPEQARSLKRLLGLNENLHTPYVLREVFGKTWDYLYQQPAVKYLFLKVHQTVLCAFHLQT